MVTTMRRSCSSTAGGRSRRRLPVVTALLLVTLAACGSSNDGSTSAATVRPFAKVQASKLVFERDPSDPSRGIFRVTTTEPMICAIVWGKTDSFGRFNNSLSMNGTGIEQHDVRLPDVEPGVAYRYVVQGTTADGTLYRSKVGTFSLPAAKTAAPEVDHGPNLARDATVVDVSSEFSDAFAARNALDGDASTEWATRGDGDHGFITIDLGASQPIGGVEFLTRSMADGSVDHRHVHRDRRRWNPGRTVPRRHRRPTRGSRRSTRPDSGSASTSRTSTGGNVGAVEIRVFGPGS